MATPAIVTPSDGQLEENNLAFEAGLYFPGRNLKQRVQ